MVDMIYLTQVHATLEGDTWFPEWDKNEWQCISEEKHPADDKNEYPYSFMVYQRK
jgi:dihydrofolate reductase